MNKNMEIIRAEARLASLNQIRESLSRWIRAVEVEEPPTWRTETAVAAEVAEASLGEVAHTLDATSPARSVEMARATR